MTESGFTQFPSAPKLPERPERPGANEEPRAKITLLPQELKDSRVVTRIRGEVVETRRDPHTQEATVRVRTVRGDIEVRLPPEQRPPQRGQQIEIEIQPSRDPSRPPEKATVRPVQERHAAPSPSTTPRVSEESSAPRPAATPVRIEVGTTPAPRVTLDPPKIRSEAAPPQQIAAGDVVRLTFLPPQETFNLIEQPVLPEQITLAILTPAAFKVKTELESVGVKSFERIITIQTPPQTNTAAENIINSIRIVLNKYRLAILSETLPEPVQITFSLPSLRHLTPAQILGRAAPRTDLLLTPPVLSAPVLNTLEPAIVISPLTIEKQSAVARASPPQTLDARIEMLAPPAPVLTEPEAPVQTLKFTPPHILGSNKAATVTGVITGQTHNNLPVLGFIVSQIGELQNFILQTSAENLTPGTQVHLTPQPQNALAAATSSTLPPLAPYLTPEIWPLMNEIYQALSQVAPALAQNFVNILPSPLNPAQITPAALFFIAAVRGLDLNAWLGDKAVDALRRAGASGALGRLSAEGSLLSRTSAEPVSQDWRAINLPMFYEGEVQKIALYYKHDRENRDSDEQKGKQTRFIFDLKLDQMGDVQLDGLFRGQRLDIILRTKSPLSQAMQTDMRETYAKALRQTMVTGELSFQNQPSQWVTIHIEDEKRFGAEA